MQKNLKEVLKERSLLTFKPNVDNFATFQESLDAFLSTINPNETEEHNKNLIRDFFKQIGYDETNTYERIDLAIFTNNIPQVLIETKSPTNKTEMVEISNLHKKSFYELVLYFLRETIKNKNYHIKYLIITNAFEWFIFDAKDFDRAIPKRIKTLYKDFEINRTLLKQKTSDFYEIIANELPKDIHEYLPFIYIDFKKRYSTKDLRYIYKIFSPYFLLKKPLQNDANTLNKNFYDELLYILGLKETTTNGKKLLVRAHIQGSMIENTILKLQTECDLSKKHLFDIALELNITWLNRILFLKLLEAKLIKIHNGDYPKFLDFSITNEFDKLNTLFFEILSVQKEDRHSIMVDEYLNLPYLNSSLFEVTDIEKKYLRISNLKDTFTIKPYKRSVLNTDKPLNTLEYLLRFLSSYDFGTEATEEFRQERLINASVLGLIFEKINGYKEGSYFTPSFITIFMTREVLQRKITDALNQSFGISAQNFEEIKNFCWQNSYRSDFAAKAKRAIDTITIVDPAVGSGHFLVSALNEIIALKNELGLFLPQFLITNENDELYIEDKATGESFEYKKLSGKSGEKLRQIQQEIFEEKKRIIEEQLFGVDINPNSVKIARLRLWIELLKSTYYDENDELATLPNIDINIKQGNSLLSRFDTKNQILNNNIKHQITRYKEQVKRYKETKDKEEKRAILVTIDTIKEMLQNFFLQNSPTYKKLNELLSRYRALARFEELAQLPDKLALMALHASSPQSGSLIPSEEEKKRLLKEIKKYYNELKQEEERYKNAFEWRFEFPEVLDYDGEYRGFDIIIANPPYIMEYEDKEAFASLHDHPCYQGKTDLWHLFACSALSIAAERAYISFIAKNQWLGSEAASKMRKFLFDNSRILTIIDFGSNMIFPEASQQTMIFFLQKESTPTQNITYCRFDTMPPQEISQRLETLDEQECIHKTFANYDPKENLTFSPYEEFLQYIESKRNFAFDPKTEIIQGIIGGPDSAFLVTPEEMAKMNEEERRFVKNFHTHTDPYYTPPSDKYILYLAKHNIDDLTRYPNIEQKLLPYYEKLAKRREVLKNRIQWFHLWWARDESFFRPGPKLIWTSRTKKNNVTFTEEEFYGSRNLFFIKSSRVSLRYICALLNSELFNFYTHQHLKHTGELLQIDKNQFLKIPLFVPDDTSLFDSLVDKIIEARKAHDETKAKTLQKLIDILVYQLYFDSHFANKNFDAFAMTQEFLNNKQKLEEILAAASELGLDNLQTFLESFS